MRSQYLASSFTTRYKDGIRLFWTAVQSCLVCRLYPCGGLAAIYIPLPGRSGAPSRGQGSHSRCRSRESPLEPGAVMMSGATLSGASGLLVENLSNGWDRFRDRVRCGEKLPRSRMQKSDHEQLPAQPITIYLMFQGAAGIVSRRCRHDLQDGSNCNPQRANRPRCARTKWLRRCALVSFPVLLTCAADSFGGCRTGPAGAGWMQKPGLGCSMRIGPDPCWGLRAKEARELRKVWQGGAALLDLFTLRTAANVCLPLDRRNEACGAVSREHGSARFARFPTSTCGAGFGFTSPTVKIPSDISSR
jgi:hypothetical protein